MTTEGDGVTDRSQRGRFDGRVAIVTGSTRSPSIGRSTARRLGAESASVVINGRDERYLGDSLEELLAAGVPAVAVAGPVGDDSVAEELCRRAVEHFGRIDLLVNTVGGVISQDAPRSLDRGDLLDTFELNCWTALSMIQAACRHGLGAPGGAVVNISSGTVHKTTSSMLAYAAAKAGLNAMTRTLAADLAGEGIRVNAVAPGLTQTTVTRSMWESDGGASVGSRSPLGRLTTADDIAAAVSFLLSDDAASITGVTIDVDAGNHLESGWSPITDGSVRSD